MAGGVQIRKLLLLLVFVVALVFAVSTSTLCASGRAWDPWQAVQVLLGDGGAR
jgi:hypothetical protein